MTLETSRTPGRRRHGGTSVKIVVTGPFSAGKTTLIRTISEITVISTEQDITDDTRSRKAATTVAMDFGRLTLDRDLVLYLLGTPGQERFDLTREILGERMLGYILLMDGSRDEGPAEAVRNLVAFRRMAGCSTTSPNRRGLSPDPPSQCCSSAGRRAEMPLY